MANAIYPLAKASFLKGELDMVDDTIKVVLVDTGTYTYNTAHDFYNDLSGILGSGVELGSRTVTLGVFDAADVTFTTPSAGTTIEALVIYKDTGNVATSNLIAYIDTGTGLAFTTNGADIDIVWDSGANKIFSI